MESKQVLSSLTNDLKSFAGGLIKSVDPFLSTPQDLSLRDDVSETHVSIGEAGDTTTDTVSGSVPYFVDQIYRVQIFIKASVGKGSEKVFHSILLDIKDIVIEWLRLLNTEDRNIYMLTNSELLTALYNGTRGEAVSTTTYKSLDLSFTSRRKINH